MVSFSPEYDASPTLLQEISSVRVFRRAKEGGGCGEDGFDSPPGRPTATAAAAARSRTEPSSLHGKEKAVGVPFAEELFGVREAELLDRGKKDAEQKRELALQKCVRWCWLNSVGQERSHVLEVYAWYLTKIVQDLGGYRNAI